MTSDEVCGEYARRGVKITVKMLEDDDGFVLIEGTSDALEFLGKLFLAQAHVDDWCSQHLGPNSAGNALFSPSSTKGIYIHRLPCDHKNDLT